MLEKLKAKTQDFKFLEFDEMEFKRDSFLISGEHPKLLEEKWLDWIENEESEHPNNFFDYINCYFDSQTDIDLNINLLLDRRYRFHSIKKLIPKSKIYCSFIPFSTEKHQYFIVDKDWFNFIRNSLYSTYALIDFVGVRAIISEYGEIPFSLVKRLKDIIDDYAKENRSYDFLTCADNIIIKSNWHVNEEVNTYSPESLVLTIKKLMTRIESEIGFSSYVIITQGANYVNENGFKEKDRLINHYFMPSISVPFVEAFEIDNDARIRIKKNEIKKSQFYLEHSFYISLNRKFYSSEEPDWFKFIEFKNSKNNNHLKYTGVSFQELKQLVELEESKPNIN